MTTRLAAAALLLLTACASSPDTADTVDRIEAPVEETAPAEEAPATETPAEEAPATEAEAPEKKWHELKGRERGAFMKNVVTPTMGALLKQMNAEEFAEVDCKTCHGKDPKAVKFKMPSPDLHKLDPSDNFAHEKADHPEEVKFMMEVFTPKMVELLGEKPYDPATGEGFGCFSCHTMKK